MDDFSALKSAAFPPNRFGKILFARHAHPTYRLITLVYFFAGACHLWLADAEQSSWFLGNLFFGAGILGLLLRPGALFWLLAMVGKLLPLLFGRDHLTQSLILLLIALGGALFCGLNGYRQGTGREQKRLSTSYCQLPSELWAFLLLLKIVTIATYALAALHKLNRDFFNPELSCATHGMNKILTYYQAEGLLPLGEIGLFIAFFAVGLEISIALFYLLGLRRLGLIAALIFHLPLTLTMAPAFAFVMLIGHAAFLRPADLVVFQLFLRRFGLPLFTAAAVLTALSLRIHGTWPELTMIPREFLLWALLGLAIFARPWNPALSDHQRLSGAGKAPKVALALGILFIFHGLTPYSGLRTQHTSAMVSNLRIDQGCWNSLIFPESWRLSDDYIRVDEVYFRAPGLVEKYERI